MNLLGTVPGTDSMPMTKQFRSSGGDHLLIVPHSRIFDLTEDLAEALRAGNPDAVSLAQALALPSQGEVELDHVVAPPAQGLSLNVSSACNLSCSYCYADRGGFGGAQPAAMEKSVAFAAVDRLLAVSDLKYPVTIGFLGGEPLVNRRLVHEVVAYANAAAAATGADVRYSITTNGTLLAPEDIELFRNSACAVTVSIDGGKAAHDRQRPLLSGAGSYDLLRSRIAPLLRNPGRARIAARATVSREMLAGGLSGHFESICAMGFPEVGFSPLRVSAGSGAFVAEDWPIYLCALTALARAEMETALAGGSIRLTNLAVALKQLYRGASSPYPCGAGGVYFSVSADGSWYACHRAVGNEEYKLGDNSVLDAARRYDFLRARHVHSQIECRTCWARYLCSGGCHQEASSRSVSGCDFIRAWLEFCLVAFCELSARRPDYFDASSIKPELVTS
jgi:uncharacterized protein